MQVTITTASVPSALVVPVTALLARSGGGYAVEVVDPGGTHHLVPVSLGLFDDADGLVQVTGSELGAGQEVVVPSHDPTPRTPTAPSVVDRPRFR